MDPLKLGSFVLWFALLGWAVGKDRCSELEDCRTDSKPVESLISMVEKLEMQMSSHQTEKWML